MNARNTHWSAVLAALALTVSLPVEAQEGTGDPFLDAMLKDQQSAPAAKADTKGSADKKEAEQPGTSAPVQVAPAFHDPTLVDNRVVERELGAGTGIFSNDYAYDGRKVGSVQIRYISGKPTVPDSRLLDVIQTRAGSTYSSAMVNDDLERLIQRGLVDGNARVAVEHGSGGLRVIFEVYPSGVMGGVGFTGNKRFKASDIREELKLKSGKVINDRELAIARAAIVKMYNEAGYPDTKVTWRRTHTARQGHDDVIFDIAEGREVSMNGISFVGNHQFDSEQLRRMMKTKERGLFTWITGSGRIKREQVEDDLQEIVNNYRNYGYLRARIAKVEYTDNGSATGRQKLYARIHIDEGPRYRVRNISFSNVTVYTPKQLAPGLSMLNGNIYSLRKVKDDTNMIREYYGAKGYADAEVRPDIEEVGVDKDGTRLVDICYRVTEGKPYSVGRINVRGNTKTKAHVILRELPLKPGRPLNSVDLETARKRLENLGYFDPNGGVEISQTASATPGYRDININVREKKTGSLTIGVAFSSIENVYLYATATQSNFDIMGLFGSGSLVGGGQRLTVSGRLGVETQSASIFLLEPWFLDRKLALGNELFFSNSSYMSDYYTQKNLGYEVSIRKALDDLRSVKLAYRIESYDMQEDSDAPQFFRENCGKFTRSNIALSYMYDSRDAQITPRKGGHFEVGASYSGPGSTVETYSFSMSGSAYYNTLWDTILSVNFGVATVDTAKKDESVPLFERCYLGGPNNLRGFRYRDVGMVDRDLAGDETMGGKSSAYVQFEMTVPVFESVRFAMFVDAGFVNEESFDFNSSQLSADYGIGLRINLPIGPLAVDYAIPFKTGNAIDRNGQFQFYVDYKY